MFDSFHIAGSALTAQSARLNAVASNMANADSVASADGKPYQARQVIFQAVPVNGGTGVRAVATVESQAPARLQYDPANPFANAQGYVQMSNVNIVEEMVNMLSASRAYQANTEVMVTAKTLMEKTLALGQ